MTGHLPWQNQAIESAENSFRSLSTRKTKREKSLEMKSNQTWNRLVIPPVLDIQR